MCDVHSVQPFTSAGMNFDVVYSARPAGKVNFTT